MLLYLRVRRFLSCMAFGSSLGRGIESIILAQSNLLDQVENEVRVTQRSTLSAYVSLVQNLIQIMKSFGD